MVPKPETPENPLVFFYSRKPQIVLFLCWCIALASLFAYATGSDPLFFMQRPGPAEPSRAVLGEVPLAQAQPDPPAEPPAPPEPAPAPPPALPPEVPADPAADPALNRATELRVIPGTGEDKNLLILELDYVAAQKNGFTPDKAHDYYTDDTPTVVVVLGSPWKVEIEPRHHPLNMEQANLVSLWMTEARQLRLITRTRTVAQAAGARVRIQPTQAGIRAEIRFARNVIAPVAE
jgi:hypothetical protein